ncbi:MAG: hypothetical protein RIM84_16515 [Alphaproteobacteria bacterium]
MDRIATTVRVESELKQIIERIGKVRGMTFNRIANIALKDFVAREAATVEGELSALLDDLRAYRERDPDFEQAINAAVKAELAVEDDPAEGSVITDAAEEQVPALTRKVRAILDA